MSEKSELSTILTSHIKVSSHELDSFGHVNNAVFLNYLEKARCDFMELRGLHFLDFSEWRRFPVVIRASLEYKKPAFAGDHLTVKGWISHYTKTSFTLQYQIFNQSTGLMIFKGETTHVFIDDHNRPTRIPDIFIERFIQVSQFNGNVTKSEQNQNESITNTD